MFSGAVANWTPVQREMAHWLRYYDNFYEMCQSQHQVCDVEMVIPAMAKYDIIVDAFFVWYRWRSEIKRNELTNKPTDANIPRASDHSQVYKSAHQ